MNVQQPTLQKQAYHLVSLLLLAVCLGCAAPDATTDAAGTTSASGDLDAIFADVWADALERSPFFRLREGLEITKLGSPSFANYQDYVSKAKVWLEQLDGIDRTQLDHAEWINLRALRWDLETSVEGERWFHHASVLTPYSNPLNGLTQILSAVPLTNGDEASRYLELLAQANQYIQEIDQLVRDQSSRGVYVWSGNLEASLAITKSFLSSDGASPFLPTDTRLDTLPEAERQRVADAARSLVEEQIDPALTQLVSFVESDEYRDAAPAAVGASQLPQGGEFYRYAVRRSTTMDVPPEQIHERGLALVQEMEDAMAALRTEAGATGTKAEFRESLRTDKSFFPKSPDEVAKRLMSAATDMEAKVDEFFLGRPKAAYDVKRLEANREGSLTYGIYEPPTPSDPVGRYRYNGSKLDQRGWLNLRGVSLHELIPGHHFHIARQAENENLPDYRRNSWHGAFTEGWGSYASYLGLEAGIYEGDPLSEYGMYILEVFLATRLVVDTGMNLLGWSLDDAREFMREHTLESETQIQTESLRYSADMPAQALAYQMGKLKLLELRARAEDELGQNFDLREFHEALLENGSLPMAVLEEHIDWWIQQQL